MFISSEPSSPNEGDDVTLTCNEKCENSTVTFQWKKNTAVEPKENNKTFLIQSALSISDIYICSVNCFRYCCDSKPYTLSVKSKSIHLYTSVICYDFRNVYNGMLSTALDTMCLHFLCICLCVCHCPDNTVIILVVCGVAALALVLIMGLIMKCKLKRDSGKSSF